MYHKTNLVHGDIFFSVCFIITNSILDIYVYNENITKLHVFTILFSRWQLKYFLKISQNKEWKGNVVTGDSTWVKLKKDKNCRLKELMTVVRNLGLQSKL